MLDSLSDLVDGGAAAYPIVAGLVAADAVVPIVPGETGVVLAGILAADGQLSVLLVLAAAIGGAFAGDNLAFGLGRTGGTRAARKLFRGEGSRRRLEWARRQLRERGPVLIMVARFVPGGRTAVTFTAGTLGMPYRRFAVADIAAAVLWGAYATALGYFGGQSFRDSLLKPLLVAAAVGTVVALGGELWRRLRAR